MFATVLNAVWAFILAHPTEDTAVLGALFAFLLSLFQKALVSSPRIAALYSIVCRLFPDLTDPKALAGDIVMLVTGEPKSPERGPKAAARLGKVLPLVALSLALSLTGCAAFQKELAVISAAETAECQILPLLTPSGAKICLAEDALIAFLHVFADALAAKKDAVFAFRSNGVTETIHVPLADIPGHITAAETRLGELGAKKAGALK